ncbi:MAG TPA: urease accessory UreF family protein [Pseudonocardia sp.]
MTTAGLLLLADSRLPSGGHGHSGGVEALVDRGLLRSVEDLAVFLAGRLATGAAVPAGAAAAGCALAGGAGPITWEVWDNAVSARLPASATRAASYAQGAALLRTASLVWRSAGLVGLRALPKAHHPLVLGAAAAAVGAAPADAALLAVHHVIGGACTAAVRLLGLDPLAVAGVAARAGKAAEPVAAAATRAARAAVATADPRLLPADGNPLHDVLAQLHRLKEATLFAS